jgi:hypothetical protein
VTSGLSGRVFSGQFNFHGNLRWQNDDLGEYATSGSRMGLAVKKGPLVALSVGVTQPKVSASTNVMEGVPA